MCLRPPGVGSLRALLAVLAAAIVGLLGIVPCAAAAPFEQSYPFTGPAAGTAGWSNLDNPSPNPWYSSSIGVGGMSMQATGNGGLIYDNAYRSGFQFQAPAGTTITRAVLGGVDARQEDRQRTRINLMPQPSSDVLTGSESWGKQTVDDGDTLSGAITLTPQPGFTPSSGLQVRHYPVACGNPGLGQPSCAAVPASTLGRARIASVTVTLDDPTPPVATLNGPAAGGWTNASSVPVSVSGQDEQSGISRIGAVVKVGSATRRPTLGSWTQDTSGNSLPGWTTSQTATGTVALPRKGTVTIAGTVRNGAQAESTTGTVTMRIDRTAPQISWPKKLQGGQTVTVRDGESRLASLTATLNGRPLRTTCPAGSKQCKVKIPTTAGGTLGVEAADVAGNVTSGERTVKRAPKTGTGKRGSGGGSKKRGPKKGSSKRSQAYCKKHPKAKGCAGRDPGPELQCRSSKTTGGVFISTPKGQRRLVISQPKNGNATSVTVSWRDGKGRRQTRTVSLAKLQRGGTGCLLAINAALGAEIDVSVDDEGVKSPSVSIKLGSGMSLKVRTINNADFTQGVITLEGIPRPWIVVKRDRAPEKFCFPVQGASSIQVQPNGSVVITPSRGGTPATLETPWAVDANGLEVPNRYVVEDRSLCHVIEHKGGRYVYPITADGTRGNDPLFPCRPSQVMMICIGSFMWMIHHNIATRVARAHISQNEQAFNGKDVAVAKPYWEWIDDDVESIGYAGTLRFDIKVWIELCDGPGPRARCQRINQPRTYRGIKSKNGPKQWRETSKRLRKLIAPYSCIQSRRFRYFRGAADFDLRRSDGKNIEDALYGDEPWNPNGVQYGEIHGLRC